MDADSERRERERVRQRNRGASSQVSRRSGDSSGVLNSDQESVWSDLPGGEEGRLSPIVEIGSYGSFEFPSSPISTSSRRSSLSASSIEDTMAGSTTPAAATTKKVTINGIEIEVLVTAVPIEDIRLEPTLPKTKRASLAQDKWLNVKTTMEKGLERKFTEILISETDLSALTNTYELVQQNKAIVDHLKNWDMDDVFTLVVGWKNNGTEAETVDLLNHWPNAEIDDIKKSNTWYHTNTSETVAPWVRQNLECSHRFILDSCDDDMKAQLTDQLVKYKPFEQGGPLTFKLLMDLVQVNSERSVKHLIGCVQSIDVKNFDGENIIEVVAQINGAHSRLKMVSFGGAESAVPITFCEDVMDALTTTSTPTFNAAFDYKQLRAHSRLNGNGKRTYKVEEVLEAALEMYNEMMQDDTWLGVKNKAKETAFVTKTRKTKTLAANTAAPPTKRRCFNCEGEDHVLGPKCPLEFDQERIAANKKKWGDVVVRGNPGRGSGRGRDSGGRGAGRGGRGGRGRGSGRGDTGTFNKWAPPTKLENNRHFINVGGNLVPYKYNKDTKRWEKDGANSTVATASATTVSPLTTATASSSANQRAALANLQQTLSRLMAEE
jgi:hypothetical protein